MTENFEKLLGAFADLRQYASEGLVRFNKLYKDYNAVDPDEYKLRAAVHNLYNATRWGSVDLAIQYATEVCNSPAFMKADWLGSPSNLWNARAELQKALKAFKAETSSEPYAMEIGNELVNA